MVTGIVFKRWVAPWLVIRSERACLFKYQFDIIDRNPSNYIKNIRLKAVHKGNNTVAQACLNQPMLHTR